MSEVPSSYQMPKPLVKFFPSMSTWTANKPIVWYNSGAGSISRRARRLVKIKGQYVVAYLHGSRSIRNNIAMGEIRCRSTRRIASKPSDRIMYPCGKRSKKILRSYD